MLFGITITKKEYQLLKDKYMDLLEDMENLKIANRTLRETIQNQDRKYLEQEYRQSLIEDDILKLNNILSSLLNEKNELNSKILKLKKKNNSKVGRPKKVKE